jgi:hypothetical protein
MPALSGKSGKVKYGGVNVFRINQWTIDIDTNLMDTTNFTTSTGPQWRTYTAGLSGAAGTISGFWDATTGASGSSGQEDMQTNILTPTTAQLILTIDKTGGPNYRGSVLLERLAVDAAIDGTVDAAYDFRFNGAVAYSTAT